MARNEEKAQSMLYRFREAQKIEMGVRSRSDKRPQSARFVETLSEAERWRRDILREMTRKMEKINDESLTEYQIRDMNDELNKLLKEKRHWEHRVKELGGADYYRRGGDLVEKEGKAVPGTRGYRYFGRARTLPGVKNLFEKAAVEVSKVRPEDIWMRADPDYFGLRDEDDGLLLAYEQAQVEKACQEIVDLYGPVDVEKLQDEAVFAAAAEPTNVPTQSEVEAWLVRRRRQQLADTFIGDGKSLDA